MDGFAILFLFSFFLLSLYLTCGFKFRALAGMYFHARCMTLAENAFAGELNGFAANQSELGSNKCSQVLPMADGLFAPNVIDMINACLYL